MARAKIQKTAAQPTYHLAERLRGLAADSLYSSTEGRRTLSPVDDFTVTALLTEHPWGYSSQVRAVDADGHLQAAGEATAAKPLPAGISSRIRTFRSGPLTWHDAARRITDQGIPQSLTPTIYVAAGNHHYELHREFNADTFRDYWVLTIDGRPHQAAFAGPTGATEFVVDTYESTI